MLHEFITANRQEIINRCRAKVAKRLDPPPTRAEIEHGVPVFLDQLVDLMRRGGQSSAEIGRTAVLHGHDLLRQGVSVSQVVHAYGDVCQAITDLAVETAAKIPTADFRTLNRCLDDAIAGAVTEYGREERASTDGKPSLYELSDLITTATLAFKVLKTGNVGVSGSTGAALDRALQRLSLLIGHSLDEANATASGSAQRL
jgi:hypothetical protein